MKITYMKFSPIRSLHTKDVVSYMNKLSLIVVTSATHNRKDCKGNDIKD